MTLPGSYWSWGVLRTVRVARRLSGVELIYREGGTARKAVELICREWRTVGRGVGMHLLAGMPISLRRARAVHTALSV